MGLSVRGPFQDRAAPSGAPSRRLPVRSPSTHPSDWSGAEVHRRSGRAFRGCGFSFSNPAPVSAPFQRRASAAAKEPHIHVSQLLAGGRSTSGRSPDAARAPACEAGARAPHQTDPGNCPAPSAGDKRAHLRPHLQPAPHSRRLMRAPLREQGDEEDKSGFDEGDNFFSRDVIPGGALEACDGRLASWPGLTRPSTSCLPAIEERRGCPAQGRA
jgi:hypothetical protein